MENLLPVVDKLLSAVGAALQDIDALAVAAGPGSFTSLRVGMATAKALAHSLGKPLTGVPTLDALAQGLQGTPGLICPVLPARAQEVYAAFYVSAPAGSGDQPWQAMKRISGYLALGPQQLAGRLQDELRARITFTGEGALAWWDMLQDVLGERAVLAEPAQLWPRAVLVAVMGMAALERRQHDGARLPPVRPLYVKPPAIRSN
jgi:tRNA threonylcarbamoyladenosine biosynthesis protein TsaB